MKSHRYEYKTLVEYITPEERGMVAHFTHKEDQESFTRLIEDVFKHLPESIPEGWEVSSHGVTISGTTIIVTVLLRRLVA
ncbi:hypothetical protein ACFLVY_01675 [Chloroflexota bacterium]